MFLECLVESLLNVLPELAILAARAVTKMIERRSQNQHQNTEPKKKPFWKRKKNAPSHK